MLTDSGPAAMVDSAPGHVRAVRSLVFDALTPAQQQDLRDAGAQIMARVGPGGPHPPS